MTDVPSDENPSPEYDAPDETPDAPGPEADPDYAGDRAEDVVGPDDGG